MSHKKDARLIWVKIVFFCVVLKCGEYIVEILGSKFLPVKQCTYKAMKKNCVTFCIWGAGKRKLCHKTSFYHH